VELDGDATADAHGEHHEEEHDARPPCGEGHYDGTFTGVHHPSILLGAVPATLAGVASFDLGPEVNGIVTVHGYLAGFVASANGSTAQPDGGTDQSGLVGLLGAELSGTLNCATDQGSGTLKNANIATLIPPFDANVTGSFTIYRDSAGVLLGGFTDEEVAVSSATGQGRFKAWRAP
jgi:hypothetical protein